MNDQPTRERLNFFTGLFTTSEDWTAEQNYHREGIRLHSQWQHNVPGLIPEYREELKVVAAGGLMVRVFSGAAVDSDGNMLLLPDVKELTIKTDGLTFDADGKALVFIGIRFHEDGAAYIENVEQPQYSNYSRIAEQPSVFITPHEPDNLKILELARIELENPDQPVVSDIDTGRVLRSITAAQHQAKLEKHGCQLEDFEERLEQLSVDSRLHTRGLHTPGIIDGEVDGLKVSASGGLDLKVARGAAVDVDGHTIMLDEPRLLSVPVDAYSLPVLVYVFISHDEGVQLTTSPLDEGRQLELARIDLQPGVTEIRDPTDDPLAPGANEINLCAAKPAGSVGIVEPQAKPELLRQLAQTMRRTRRDFVALDDRFPTPSVVDVRHSSLTVETIARIGQVRPRQLSDLMATLAAIEQDVAQEVDLKYGNIVNETTEYQAYVDAHQNLDAALKLGIDQDIITAQDTVAEAARELSELGVESPIADAGRNQNLTTIEDEKTTILDASRSRGRGDREIDSYRWDVIE